MANSSGEMAVQIDDYRTRYSTAPLGAWATAQGTFDVVSHDTFTFYADHTGLIQYGSAFSGESEVRFEWREKGERLIELRYVDEDDANEDELWDKVAYDFRLIETDTGEEVVLYEIGQDGFWDSLSPLRHIKQ